MDEAWKMARRDELWDAYVHKVPEIDLPAGTQDRALQAVEMLRLLHSVYNDAFDANDVDLAMHTAARGRVVWQLLTYEFGDWLLDGPLPNISVAQPEEWEGFERVALQYILRIHEELGPHPHRPALDPVSVQIPRWLLQKLAGALEALGDGEVQDMVRPTVAGRHGNAWSWDRMRSGALEHVAFLQGQGQTKKVAQQRVAARMGIPPTTLRDWERDDGLRNGCEAAYEAGKLKIIFEDDPKYAESDGRSVDSSALARLVKFRSEPSLADFAAAYREKFGRRHNPNTGADN
jgi:hypothetical protein